MVSLKRGGFRGGGVKKSYAKKRSPEDEDATPRLLNNSGKRRVTVSDFKGMTLVSIREYYTNDAGELKPGKKGVSLSLDQYNALLTTAPLLESVLSKEDFEVKRPNYDADLAAAKLGEEKEEEQQPVTEVDDVENEA
ncbi:PC4-domain-containing protein [Didymella exigua CBS 183.55]|uniref:PC4-domain-containing protein n=1 Tax=Didymella exigua CBS 183.55 TaxID=1150837 RepID=A0A6A5RTM1_9PLEO|nr:PC4-domain-containing protein [Didymella exigua CBS 183.55]KAF1931835.1 PC4-domain-containing protein [Didymella exigua CBS 183.55]